LRNDREVVGRAQPRQSDGLQLGTPGLWGNAFIASLVRSFSCEK
jgi:hypothetical protein